MSRACRSKLPARSPLLLAGLACALVPGSGALADGESLADVIKTFGPGVITTKSDPPRIDSFEEFIAADFGSRVFMIVEGNDQGQMMVLKVEPKDGAEGVHLLHLDKGHVSTILTDSSSLYRSQEVDDETSSIASFDPAEPVLLSKQGLGKPLEMSIAVSVSSTSNPGEVTHRGTLKCTYEVLGSFQVKSTAGVFDTICIRTSYLGTVGPANVDDSRYVFFAKGVGPIALRTSDHVQAMLFYNKTNKQSLLLHELNAPPTPPGLPAKPGS